MTDYIIRATAAEGQIRAFAATTRDLVEAARDAHNTSPVATAALGLSLIHILLIPSAALFIFFTTSAGTRIVGVDLMTFAAYCTGSLLGLIKLVPLFLSEDRFPLGKAVQPGRLRFHHIEMCIRDRV